MKCRNAGMPNDEKKNRMEDDRVKYGFIWENKLLNESEMVVFIRNTRKNDGF
jgi:hypothetical protein